MDDYSKPKTTLVIKVMEHETLTGADGEQRLDFDDSVNAVNGLIGWLARSLAGEDDLEMQKIGSDILVAALYSWTYDRPSRPMRDETGELLDDDDFDDDEYDDDMEELDEDEGDEYPPN